MSAAHHIARTAALLLAAALAAGCASYGAESEAAARRDAQELASRTLELERAVRRDHARLIEMVTTPRAPGSEPLYENPELQAIAERLPKNQRELAALAGQAATAADAQRVDAAPPTGTPGDQTAREPGEEAGTEMGETEGAAPPPPQP